MKATLIFDFDKEDSDDRVKHARMMKSFELCACLWDIDQFLREKLKYGNDYKSADEALEKTRDKLHELMQDSGIVLDHLYN